MLPNGRSNNNIPCVPKRKIGFLKTHKCASSSVQNILLRYVLKHNLNVVLPEKHNYLGYDRQFTRGMIANTVWEKANLIYDMFLCHTRWNHEEISQVLERGNEDKDIFYFSILRDPVSLYRSYWDYYGLAKRFNSTLDAYAKSVISKTTTVYTDVSKRPPGYNQMLTDFGLDFRSMIINNGSSVKSIKDNVIKKIQEIDQTFDLIILADDEYFEDGMILLKNSLCWKYEDVINVKHLVKKNPSYLSDESGKIIKGSGSLSICNCMNDPQYQLTLFDPAQFCFRLALARLHFI